MLTKTTTKNVEYWKMLIFTYFPLCSVQIHTISFPPLEGPAHLWCQLCLLEPAVHGRGRLRLRYMFQRYAKQKLECSVQSCAEDQNIRIVRCSKLHGRPYHDFWRVPKTPPSRPCFSRGIYDVFRSSDSISEGVFFTVSPKVLGKVERERESRIRTEQKSTMGMRPLDESAPSAR